MSNKIDMSLARENGVFIPDGIRSESIKARSFLQSHPAIGWSTKEGDLFFSIHEVCKRGISEDGPITVWNTPTNRKKFKKDFDKRYDKEELDKNPLCSIYKKYKDVYGEEWKFHHIEYWWETSFSVFEGDVSRESNEWMDMTKWQNYEHGSGGTLTLEEAYIDAANIAKKTLGDFYYDSFINDIEKENHKKHHRFNLKKSDKKGTFNPFTGRNEELTELVDNNKHLNVSNGMQNRRWLNWFFKTPYCKKNWKTSFKGLVKIQPPND
jgi:hypothetical protein